MKQVKVCLGRFMPFHLGHLKMATYKDLKGPDKEQQDKLREQPNLKEIANQKTIILSILTTKDKVDTRHPFDAELMKDELELLKKNYSSEIEDIMYVKSADICAWGEMLKQKGYQASVWLTGSDEFTMYKGMAIKVPEYEEHNRNNYDCKDAYTKSFYVENIERTNEGDFVSTISGTKVRQALLDNDKELFSKMMPKGADKYFDKFKDAVENAPEPIKKSKKKIKEGMMTLKNYIFENNISDLKDKIIMALNNQNDEAFLNKIYKQVNTKEPKKIIQNIKDYLDSRNIDEPSINHIIKLFKHYVSLNEMNEIINTIKTGNIKGVKYFTSNDLKNETEENIYEKIYKFIDSVFKNTQLKRDDELNSLIKELALSKFPGTVSRGKYELLINIFIKDWNNTEGYVGDVTTSNGGFEIKTFGGRIAGNKNTTKLKSSKDLDVYCKEIFKNKLLKTNKYDEKGIEQQLSLLGNRIFETKGNIENFITVFENTFDSKEDYKQIFKEIVIGSFIKLFKDEELQTHKTTDSIFVQFNNLKIDLTTKDNVIEFIQNVWLFVCLLHYRYTENFNYLTVFSNKNEGSYKTIDLKYQELNDLIIKIYDIIFGNNKIIKCKSSSDLPKNTNGSNAQNNAAPIALVE